MMTTDPTGTVLDEESGEGDCNYLKVVPLGIGSTVQGIGATIDEKAFLVFCGCCMIRILTLLTKIMEGICLTMEKSFIGHSIGKMRGNKPESSLVHSTIDVGRQCKLKGESHCEEKPGPKIRKDLCSNQYQWMA